VSSQARWALTLMRGLAEAGVRDVVISPGSRSTPFVLAAASVESMREHVVVDERSAAFFALGQARLTGRPSLLICTSGTAAAHYYPAVIEAAQDCIPLLVLSADRPTDLHGCAAPQTVDQLKLYGAYAKRFVEIGEARDDARALRALRREAASAVASTLGPGGGCVHLNARARKPLEPSAGEVTKVAGWSPRLSVGRSVVDADVVRELVGVFQEARRPMIVAGPAALAAGEYAEVVGELSELTGAGLLVDATSQIRFGAAWDRGLRLDHFDLVLGSAVGREELRPDLILQVGRPPTSSAWLRLVAQAPDVRHIVLAAGGWPDAESTARWVIRADVGLTLTALRDAIAGEMEIAGDERWRKRLQGAIELTRVAVMDEVCRDDAAGMSELAAVHVAVESLPDGANLIVGNSLPIRHVDALVPADARSLKVFSQRGANGIDGLVSGAAGVASLSSAPSMLILGDISLLHDIGGLAATRSLSGALIIIALNNGGGRIFEQLPVASRPELAGAMPLFTTPQECDFSGAAALYGLPFHRVTSAGQLRDTLDEVIPGGGVHLLEVVVSPGSAREGTARLVDRVAAELSRR